MTPIPYVISSCLRMIGLTAGELEVEHEHLFALHIVIDHWWCRSDIIGVVVVLRKIWRC
jgi:hypothetical protein